MWKFPAHAPLKWLWIVSCAVMLCGTAHGEDKVQATVRQQIGGTPQADLPLTLQKAYAIALERNLSIKAAKAQLSEAQADILISRMRLNPSFVTDLGFIAEKTYRVGGIMQTFEPPGKRGLRIRVARDQSDQATFQVAQTVHQILSQVRQAHTAWIAALAKEAFQNQNAQALKAIADVAQKRYTGKEVEALDVNQSQMLAVQAQNEILKAHNNVQETQIILASLLNLDHFTAPVINKFDTLEHVNLPPLQTLVNTALARRKDLKANTAAMQTEEDRVRLFKRSRLPNLTVTSGYDIVTPDNKKFIGGNFTMAQFEIPIFNHQQGNIAKSQATHQRLQAERAALMRQIQKEIQISYQRVNYNEAQWHRFQTELLPLADIVDKQALDSYQRGKTGINDVIGQHQNAYNIRQEALDTFISYQNAVSDLQTALSKSISGSSASPMPNSGNDTGGDDASGSDGNP